MLYTAPYICKESITCTEREKIHTIKKLPYTLLEAVIIGVILYLNTSFYVDVNCLSLKLDVP